MIHLQSYCIKPCHLLYEQNSSKGHHNITKVLTVHCSVAIFLELRIEEYVSFLLQCHSQHVTQLFLSCGPLFSLMKWCTSLQLPPWTCTQCEWHSSTHSCTHSCRESMTHQLYNTFPATKQIFCILLKTCTYRPSGKFFFKNCSNC